MATPSTSTPNYSQSSLPGMTGGLGPTTNLETIGPGASSTTQNLPVASGVGVHSPSVFRPTEYALLTLQSTTVTAYAVPGTTGLAILDNGSGGAETLTFRAEGTTLSGGDVVSLGFNGLVESTTTATYQPFTGVSGSSVAVQTVSGSTSFSLPTAPGPVIFGGSTLSSTRNSSATSGSTMGAGLTSSAQSMATLTSSQSGMPSQSGGGSGGAGGGGSANSASTSMEGGGGAGGAASSSSQQAGPTVSAGRAAMLLGAVGGVMVWGM